MIRFATAIARSGSSNLRARYESSELIFSSDVVAIWLDLPDVETGLDSLLLESSVPEERLVPLEGGVENDATWGISQDSGVGIRFGTFTVGSAGLIGPQGGVMFEEVGARHGDFEV